MQKLWIVSELFPPEETSTSYILGEIAKAMTSKYDVNVICGPEVYDRQKSVSKVKLSEDIKVNRVKGVNLDKNSIIGKLAAFIVVTYRLYRLARRLIAKDDKVLLVTNPAPVIVPLARLKKKKGFALNILVHDVFPENVIAAGMPIPKVMVNILKRFFDRSYSRADNLIVLGRDMESVMRDKISRFSSDAKITIIQNWGDVKEITPVPFPQGRIIVQYAGNIGRAQGLENVVKSLPDDIDLHIYGTGAMEPVIRKMNRPNIFLHGWYKRSEQTEILGKCDIALVTLRDGMFGLGVPSKTYNIMAAGRPILFLGPEDSEIDCLIKEKGIGYCSWPETWDREELKRMGAKARKIAEEEYSESAILDRFLGLI